MAERNDISVDWAESPRIIEVAAPSQALEIQDLHDTLRADTGVGFAESDLDNLDEPYLIDSAGKENLGGGVTVGITSTLQNGQVAFESRLTPTSSGSVTTPDSNGRTLEDSGATFITDGVTRGAVVINFSDQSITEVLKVLSQTQLACRVLRAGTTNQFTASDAYKIWNVVQCEISGGNLVAQDQAAQELAPVFPTAFTQIVRTASSSATLLQSDVLAALDPTRLDEVWTILGLDASNPLVVTKTTQSAGAIDQAITGDGENISTVTRQP